ncbi:retinol dehydrogenase 13 [Xylariaceae sp. FL0255]|nr:retinol dehydrogenase 13 [Xylariaceae sp. FL0255]
MAPDMRPASELARTYKSQIKDKVVLTTGVSPGSIGAAFVQAIASAEPGLLILAGRNLDKLKATADIIAEVYPEVNIRTLLVDLGSFESVRSAAKVVLAWADVPRIDVLINNAAVMAIDWSVSLDGYDTQLVINHLGPFLFTNLVMSKLLKCPSPRIVNITSDGHRLSPFRFDDYNFRDGEYYNKWQSYGQSKTANMLMAISLAENLGTQHKLSAFSVYPGLILTSGLASHLKLFGDSDADLVAMMEIDRVMGNRVGFDGFEGSGITPKSAEVGANTYVFAAFDPEVTAHNGAYLQNCRVSDPLVDTVRPWATSPIEAERLWRLSEKLVGQSFSY